MLPRCLFVPLGARGKCLIEYPVYWLFSPQVKEMETLFKPQNPAITPEMRLTRDCVLLLKELKRTALRCRKHCGSLLAVDSVNFFTKTDLAFRRAREPWRRLLWQTTKAMSSSIMPNPICPTYGRRKTTGRFGSASPCSSRLSAFLSTVPRPTLRKPSTNPMPS